MVYDIWISYTCMKQNLAIALSGVKRGLRGRDSGAM
jgi:hypothetical protein